MNLEKPPAALRRSQPYIPPSAEETAAVIAHRKAIAAGRDDSVPAAGSVAKLRAMIAARKAKESRPKPKSKAIPKAEHIAAMADRGKDVSSRFTNSGKMMPAIRCVKDARKFPRA